MLHHYPTVFRPIIPSLISSHFDVPVPPCKQVGDPKQLPATVLSQQASRFNFERSLFERMQTAGYPVTLLSTQVRPGQAGAAPCHSAGWTDADASVRTESVCTVVAAKPSSIDEFHLMSVD